MPGQQQHVDLHRKLLLRRRLLRGEKTGLAYVPFIGDGDIASQVYEGWTIFGADLDAERVETARGQLDGARVEVADCDEWPFPDVRRQFHMADFDAYAHPYASFRAFWANARKARRLVLVFTDGERQAIVRAGVLRHPDGSKRPLDDLRERRRLFNFYFRKVVLPWFRDYIEPYAIVRRGFYLRGMMLYWGAVIERETVGG